MIDCKVVEFACTDICITRLVINEIVRQALFDIFFQALSR